ncbi:MAG: hypothetical protein D6814_14585, partial [Calditrichaeota bacterium]
LGQHGVLSGIRRANGRVEVRKLSPQIPARAVKDIIGCGDAFGAAFVVHYLTHGDFFGASRFATQIATLNTNFIGSLTRDKFEKEIQPYANTAT